MCYSHRSSNAWLYLCISLLLIIIKIFPYKYCIFNQFIKKFFSPKVCSFFDGILRVFRLAVLYRNSMDLKCFVPNHFIVSLFGLVQFVILGIPDKTVILVDMLQFLYIVHSFHCITEEQRRLGSTPRAESRHSDVVRVLALNIT